MHGHAHTCTHMHTHACTHTHTHIYTHTCTYTHTHTHARTHIPYPWCRHRLYSAVGVAHTPAAWPYTHGARPSGCGCLYGRGPRHTETKRKHVQIFKTLIIWWTCAIWSQKTKWNNWINCIIIDFKRTHTHMHTDTHTHALAHTHTHTSTHTHTHTLAHTCTHTHTHTHARTHTHTHTMYNFARTQGKCSSYLYEFL
jgi:hypothetical protein